jgi:RNA polymerase sigma-70 factor (ECF subfamily)
MACEEPPGNLFVARFGAEHGLLDPQALSRQLESLVLGARAAWPTVALDVGVFSRYLADRIPSDDKDVGEALRALHATDLYLACACSRDDKEALAAFQDAFFPDVDVAIRRMSKSAEFSDEARQRLRVKLFVADEGALPRITEYSGRGDLRSWFRVVITREALSMLRQTEREESLDEDALSLLACSSADPEMKHLRVRYDAAFQSAFRAAVQALSSHERNLLRHHYIDRLSIDQIGKIYRIHRMTAARRLTKVRHELIESTRALLATTLHASESEVRSIFRLLRSGAHISIRRALQDSVEISR